MMSITTLLISLLLLSLLTQAPAQNYSEEEREALWKQNLKCTKETDKSRINLRSLTGTFVFPYIYAPPYWDSFGKTLCKWIHMVPESKDKLSYSGKYFSSDGDKIHSYTGSMKFNRKDGVYNVEENFTTINQTSAFSVVPCVVSADTVMFYAPLVTEGGSCTSQSFVLSRNFKTMSEDSETLKKKCLVGYGIPRIQYPKITNGCEDVGLFS